MELFSQRSEERFDRIVRLAAHLLDVPVAMLNLVTDRHWTKAGYGVEERVLDLADSFCRHVVESGVAMHVPDLSRDERFSDNRFVTGAGLRFYAGEPLTVAGRELGTLCVLDTRPRTLTDEQRAVLDELAAWAEAELNNSALNELVEMAQQQERHLRSILDATPDAVLLVDAEGRLSQVNRAAESLFGPLTEVAVSDVFPSLSVGRTPLVPLPDEGWPIRRVAQARAPGRRVTVEITVTGHQGVAGGWLILARDLTQQVQADARLRRQERLLERILESAGDGIVGASNDGHILFVNPAASELLGWSQEELVGRQLHAVAHHSRPDGSPYPASECPTYQAVRTGKALPRRDEVFWRKDGTTLPVELRVRPMVLGDGSKGAVTTFYDISERREVERLKAEFIGVVSHELRTPLTSISGSLRLLDAGVMGPVTEEQRPLLTMALSNAKRLGALVDDILDLERLDAGRMPLRPERIDAGQLARSVVESLQPAAAVAEVELSAVVPEEPVLVFVDPSRMTQALTNLVGNANKFTGAGGRVTVGVRRDGNEVRWEVQDTGPGIAPEELDKVFERFRQVGPSDASRKGTGLGLSIARGIVERSGGRLEVSSVVGEGSIFSIVVPVAPEHDAEAVLGGQP